MIAIDLSKQQALHADQKAMQQNNFTGSLEQQVIMLFITEKVQEIVLNFSQGTVFLFYFLFNIKNDSISQFKRKIA